MLAIENDVSLEMKQPISCGDIEPQSPRFTALGCSVLPGPSCPPPLPHLIAIDKHFTRRFSVTKHGAHNLGKCIDPGLKQLIVLMNYTRRMATTTVIVKVSDVRQ